MGTVTVEVNSRSYVVGCEDGQEAHVEALARLFDEQVREVGSQVGQVGELRLFLMAALLGADELADARTRLAEAEADLERFRADEAAASARAAAALEAAALRIEALAERTG
ncbi:MAG TPA: cell division protein ZapA [Caulobacteraceae bacterium]|jgi:cell division protein ZapA|nr:cell division protein ZapA [Caulobacteraceae bacterium]